LPPPIALSGVNPCPGWIIANKPSKALRPRMRIFLIVPTLVVVLLLFIGKVV